MSALAAWTFYLLGPSKYAASVAFAVALAFWESRNLPRLQSQRRPVASMVRCDRSSVRSVLRVLVFRADQGSDRLGGLWMGALSAFTFGCASCVRSSVQH